MCVSSVVVDLLKIIRMSVWSPNSMKSYLFERRAVMNFGILWSEAGPLKNLCGPSSVRNGREFRRAATWPPILPDVVKVDRAIHALRSHRFDAPALRSIQSIS